MATSSSSCTRWRRERGAVGGAGARRSGDGVTRVVLVVHHERAQAADLAREASAWLRGEGIEVVMPSDDAIAASLAAEIDMVDGLAEGADVVVSLGGDGTMLRAVALASPLGVPVLGVNVGVLGYLAEVEPGDLRSALERYLSEQYTVEQRIQLEVSIHGAAHEPQVHWGLNEVVIEKREAGHTVRLLPWIGGVAFTPYSADGLIVATPTGSTAYNLSARGPIVSPRLAALLLTPVSPHMLFDRTLVLHPDESLEVEVIGHRSAVVALDGRPLGTVTRGDRIRCGAAPMPARFVRFAATDFHQKLKAKFGLTSPIDKVADASLAADDPRPGADPGQARSC